MNNDGKGCKASLAPILGTKLQSLCNTIDPTYSLDTEVQERLVEMADTFIEKVTKDAIKLAKHRGSNTLDVVDMALALKKGYGISIPGLGPLTVAGGASGGGAGTSGWLLNDSGAKGSSSGSGNEGGGDEQARKKMKVGSAAAAAAAM